MPLHCALCLNDISGGYADSTFKDITGPKLGGVKTLLCLQGVSVVPHQYANGHG